MSYTCICPKCLARPGAPVGGKRDAASRTVGVKAKKRSDP